MSATALPQNKYVNALSCKAFNDNSLDKLKIANFPIKDGYHSPCNFDLIALQSPMLILQLIIST